MASPMTTVTEFFKRMTGKDKPTPEPAKPEPVAEKTV